MFCFEAVGEILKGNVKNIVEKGVYCPWIITSPQKIVVPAANHSHGVRYMGKELRRWWRGVTQKSQKLETWALLQRKQDPTSVWRYGL